MPNICPDPEIEAATVLRSSDDLAPKFRKIEPCDVDARPGFPLSRSFRIIRCNGFPEAGQRLAPTFWELKGIDEIRNRFNFWQSERDLTLQEGAELNLVLQNPSRIAVESLIAIDSI